MPSASWQPGLKINLDKVPKKYAGLDGTEIAISESQERMAVVIDPKDREQFLTYAAEENLEAYRSCSRNRGPASGTVLERQRRSSIFPVHSWIPTEHIRRHDVFVEIPKSRGHSVNKEAVTLPT